MEAIRDLVLHSGALPGLAAAALVASAFALLGTPIPIVLPLLAWAGVTALYAADRTLSTTTADAINQPARTAWMQRHRQHGVVGIALAALSLMISVVWLVPPTVALGISAFGIVAVLKVVPIRRRERPGKHWRSWSKPLGGALLWTLGGVGLPVLYLSASSVPYALVDVLALCGYRFGFLLANFVLSDWPDRTGDLAASRWTPALYLPEYQLRLIAATSLVVSIGFGVWLASRGNALLVALDLIAPCTMLLLLRRPLPEHRGFYHALDALVAWPILIALIAAWS